MAKIITAAPGAFQSMLLWTDAFTAMLESGAEARNNSQIRREVNESVKELRAKAKETPTANNKAISANQDAIAAQMAFDPDAHRALMACWRICKQKLIATGWDLGQDIKFEPRIGGSFFVWQGDEKTGELFPPQDGNALMLFLKFVYDTSNEKGPKEYTQEMLLKQGINALNFHEYADRLAIANPWLDGP